MALIFPGLGGGYKTIAAMAIAEAKVKEKKQKRELGSLDYVGLNIYLENARALGAKIGKKNDNTILWEV